MENSQLKKLGFETYPKLVIFDLDGTLVDSASDLTIAVDSMLEQLNRPSAGEKRVRQWVGNGAEKLVRRAMAWSQAGSLAGDELENKSNAISAMGIKIPLILFLDAYNNNLTNKTTVYPGVIESLDSLKAAGSTLAVVTNKPIALTLPILKGLKLESYFDSVFGGDCLEQKKPSPLPLLKTLEKFSVTSAEALMVGDSKPDVESAQAAGIKVMAVSYGYGKDVQQLGADLVVDKIEL